MLKEGEKKVSILELFQSKRGILKSELQSSSIFLNSIGYSSFLSQRMFSGFTVCVKFLLRPFQIVFLFQPA
jgi:hypothetical protein